MNTDLISRQAAIEAIRKDPMGGLNYEGILTRLPSVTPRQEPCEDCISRQAAIDAINRLSIHEFAYAVKTGWIVRDDAVDELRQLPSVNPKPKTGHWVCVDQEPHEDWECDRCRHIEYANEDVPSKYHFCPNCGAKMVEPQESEG